MIRPKQILAPGLALACLSTFAEEAPVADAAAVQTVTVVGLGQARQVSTLGPRELEEAPAGTSPLKSLSALPGVNFQSADPAGAYEWSTKLSIRGFGQNQLGFTLDDVPLGDMSYRNHNGLHVSRAIISEDVERATLSQGTGALETASSSNLGGTIQFRSRDPLDTRGARVVQTLGSDDLSRTYVRLDSGRLAGDARLALSGIRQEGDKWKGGGGQRQNQVDLKFVDDIGGNRLAAFVDTSYRQEVDYQDLSKDMISRLGWRWDNYYPDWQAALNSARHVWTQGETSIDDAYYAGAGQRTDVLAGASFDWGLGDDVSWKNTVYRHTDHGPSLWWTPYVASSADVPVSLRTVEYGIHRDGWLSSVTWQAGRHEIEGGTWIESNRFDQAMRFYSQDNGPSSPYSAPGDPMRTNWDYRFQTRTLQFHLQDTTRWTRGLRTQVGFKSLSSHSGVSTRAGDAKDGAITARGAFLPQAGINLKLDAAQELFAAAARNLRAYKAEAMEDSPFATTQAGFDAIRPTLRPETSTTWEAGWRYHAAGVEASVAVYHVDFRNRLLAIQQGSAIVGDPSVLANVGRVRTDGVEAALAWTPAPRWRWTASASLNDSRYRDDFTDEGQTVAVAGKQVVDAPRWIADTQLGYDDGQLFGHVGANATAKRYYTYLNDNRVASYLLVDLSVGWKGTSHGLLKAWRAQANVQNLFDRRYVASIGTNGFVTSDPAGTAQTLLPGAPRSVSVSLGADF